MATITASFHHKSPSGAEAFILDVDPATLVGKGGLANLEIVFEKRALGGVRWKEAGALAESLGLSLSDLARHAGLSVSTFFSRKGSRFDAIESDRLIRFERLLALAKKTIGDTEAAAEWLRMPQVGLGGEVPLEKAKTEPGARQVETLLQRIDFGLA